MTNGIQRRLLRHFLGWLHTETTLEVHDTVDSSPVEPDRFDELIDRYLEDQRR